MKILIVDDEQMARRALERILQRLSFVETKQASSLAEARAELARGEMNVVLIDLRIDPATGAQDGLTLLREVKETTDAAAIVVSGSQELSEVRAAMRMGAHDYILKEELSEELVLPIIEGLHRQSALETEVRRLRARRDVLVPGLVGTSAPMQKLRSDIARVAMSDRPVLVRGPTGAGKELVVQAIHAMSDRAEAPLLDLNCGALPPSLIESQLFGHVRGAFTGADRDHDGYFSAVRKGTFFLDEIAELPFDLQSKLLRVLETGVFRPVGSGQLKEFRGRVVAATHANIEERVLQHSFREDLLYRLNVLEIRVPTVEERPDDIPLLIAHFAHGQPRSMVFEPDAMEALCRVPWPGNVRQLRNAVDRLAVFAPPGPITAKVVAEVIKPRSGGEKGGALTKLCQAVLRMPELEKLALLETTMIEEAMRLSNGNKASAARLLGVHRKVIERRMSRAPDVQPEIALGHEDERQVQFE